MPRNSQGLYTLPAGNPVVPNTLIEAPWANTTMDDIAAALTGSLPRDGSAPMTAPLTLTAAAPTQPRHAVSKAYMDQFLAYATGMPIGAVFAVAGSVIPPGTIECNGQALSRTTYADLFATIGTIYGAGDGSTTFNVPDLRDYFIRGKADARTVGSVQAASLASHIHPLTDPGHTHGASQAAHDHTITTGSHAHGVNDPGHSHNQPVGLTFGGYSNTDNGGGVLETYNVSTAASGTGISIQTAGNLGGSADARQPAVTVDSATTGITSGAAGGLETVPQNYAMIYVIKSVDDAGNITGITGVDTSDAQMIAIDNTNPVVPLLDIKSNVAFGTVKLDAGGKVPLNQMPTSSQQLLGYFDASSGQNPTEEYPTQTFHAGDTYIISVGGSITVYDPVTLVSSLTPVSAGNLLQYVTGSVSNPTGWYYAVQSTTVIASQVGFTPAAGISATDVQAAIVEVQGNIPVNASEVPFTPAGTIAATNTQAAIAELDSETQTALALKSDIATTVTKDSDTGAANLPAGAQIQRPTVPAQGMLRFNTDSSGFEGFNGTAWTSVGAASASQVAFTPVGTIAATNVQSAIAELDSETQAALATKVTTAQLDAATKGPAFSATRAPAAFSGIIADGAIVANVEVFDTNNAFSAGKFTPQVAGYYQVNLMTFMDAGATNQINYHLPVLLKNGANYRNGSYGFFSGAGGEQRQVSGAMSCLVYMNGTTDNIQAAHSSQVAASCNLSVVEFSAALVRAA